MELNRVTNTPKPIQMLTNFWPALLVILLVWTSLPSTVPDLKEIPERISPPAAEAAQVKADTKAKAKASKKPALPDPSKKPAEAAAAPLEDSGRTYQDGVYTGSARGYGGEITAQVTVAAKKITAVQVLSAPGETAEFLNKAKGVIDRVLQAQTWEVDAVSGATYSSKGILGAIQNALTGRAVQNAAPSPSASGQAGAPQEAPQAEPYDDSAAWKDGVYTGTARGYGGNITVEVTIRDGKIADIRVLDHSGESDSYFERASAVIERILSAGSPNVDTVSGATYSSTGIINAVKRALQKAAVDGSAADDVQEEEEEPQGGTGTDPQQPADPGQDNTEEPDLSNGFRDGSYSVEVDCTDGRIFDYTIRLTMVVKNGKIQSIKAERTKDRSENPDMNATYLGYAVSGRSVDGKQYKSVIAQVLAAQSTKNVDAVTGATWSSNAILRGIRQLFAKAAKDKTQVEDPDTGEDKSPSSGDNKKPGGSKPSQGGQQQDQKPEEEPDPVLDDGLKDGTYTADAVCTDDPDDPLFDYTVRVTMKIKGGVIRSVQAKIIKDRSEDPETNKTYFGYALKGRTKGNKKYEGIPAQILAGQSTKGVDAVSGATWSSQTILNAARKLLRQAAGNKAGQADEEEETSPGQETGGGKTPEKTPDQKPGGKTDDPGEKDPGQTPGSGDDPSRGGETQKDPVTWKDGTYTSEVICRDDANEPTFDYTIAVTVVIENGAIASIDAARTEDRSWEPQDNERYFGFARDGRTRKGVFYKGVPAQALDAQGTDGIDAVSTATYSSNALITGIRSALEAAEAAAEADQGGTSGTEDPGTTNPTDPGTTDPGTEDPGTEEPSNPGTEDPADPGTTDPADPGTTEPTNPGTTDPTDPGTTDPGTEDPGTTDPTDPGTEDPTEPTNPGTTDPTDPGTTDPGTEDPGTTDPTDPGTTDPTDPGTENPTGPGTTDPTDPGTTDPTDPGTTDPTDPGTTDPTDPGTENPADPGQEAGAQNKYLDGTYTASALCTDNPDDPFFYYEVKAVVVVEGGGITSVSVERINDESDDPSENESYMKYAVNGRRSTAGIPDQVLQKQSGDGLDAVSGATYSSAAVIEAVGNALAAAVNPAYE